MDDLLYNDSKGQRVPVDFEDLPEDWENNSTRNCSMWFNEYCEPQDDYIDRMYDHIYPDNYEWALICAHFIVFVVGLVGNALVCVAVFRNTSMRTVTNYFIVNLAVADFMVILFCLPPTVAWDITGTWFLGDAMCKIVLYFQTVSVSVSVLTLTVISVERWYAICFPLRFKATTTRAKRLVFIIWVISLIIDIPELIVLETMKNPKIKAETVLFTQCNPSWGFEWDIAHTILRSLILYLIPLLFMSFAYYQIVRVLWSSANIPGNPTVRRHTTRVVNGNGATNNHTPCQAQLLTPILRGTSGVQGAQADYQLKSRRKAAKMLVAVVIMFAVCYLPVHIYSIATLIAQAYEAELPEWLRYMVLLCHWLAYFNSAVNPVIYNFMSGKFRREFARAFQCMCKFRNEFLRTFGCRKCTTNPNRGHPFIRRMNQQPRFNSAYGRRGLSSNSASYIYTRRTEFTRTPPTYFA